MKIQVVLTGADGTVHKSGRVEIDKIHEAHLITYNGHVYGFQYTAKVREAVFVETGEPVLLMNEDFQ